MGKRVDVEHLVGASDIRQRLGLARTQDVHTLRRRDPTFPEPVAVVGGGPSYGILVWCWPDVAAWARRKGIEILPQGARPKPPTPSARSRQDELARMRAELAQLGDVRAQLGELAALRARLEALEGRGPEPGHG